MRVLIQRSGKASVTVDNHVVGAIDSGLVVFVGFTDGDSISQIEYLAKKIVNLRIHSLHYMLIVKKEIDLVILLL